MIKLYALKEYIIYNEILDIILLKLFYNLTRNVKF